MEIYSGGLEICFDPYRGVKLTNLELLGNLIMYGLGLLVRAECVRCPWLQLETKVATIGPSGVRALPLATGINKGGH